MSFVLNGTTIRRPMAVEESNSSQFSQQRTLSGSIGRDYFGSNKRIWTSKYETVTKADFDTINNIYQAYLVGGGVPVTWAITEPNYTVSQTNVHVDLQSRGFSTAGSDFLSEFDLVLTEA